MPLRICFLTEISLFTAWILDCITCTVCGIIILSILLLAYPHICSARCERRKCEFPGETLFF